MVSAVFIILEWTETLQWCAVANMDQPVCSTSCVSPGCRTAQVSCSNRKIFDLPGRQRAIVLLNWPITFDRQSWWCFTFINLVCCEHSKKMEMSILTIIVHTDNQRVAGTADRPASQRPLATEASGLCQLTEMATALCSQIMGIMWGNTPPAGQTISF